MSKYQALIDALEAVTSTNWEHDGGADVFEVDVGVLVASTMETEDAAYIAEANPSTIRALLADLEAAEKALKDVEAAMYMDDAGQVRLTRGFDETAFYAALAQMAGG